MDIIKIISFIVISFSIVLAGLAFYNETKLIENAHHEGCTYLGRARDVVRVRFYECNGKAEMRLDNE